MLICRSLSINWRVGSEGWGLILQHDDDDDNDDDDDHHHHHHDPPTHIPIYLPTYLPTHPPIPPKLCKYEIYTNTSNSIDENCNLFISAKWSICLWSYEFYRQTVKWIGSCVNPTSTSMQVSCLCFKWEKSFLNSLMSIRVF